MAALPIVDDKALALPWGGPIVRESKGALEVLVLPPPALGEPMTAVFVAVRREPPVFVPAKKKWSADRLDPSPNDGWVAYPFDVPDDLPESCEVLMFLQFDQAPAAVPGLIGHIGTQLPIRKFPERLKGALPRRLDSKQALFGKPPADHAVGQAAIAVRAPSKNVELCGDQIELLARGLVRIPPTVKSPDRMVAPLDRIVFVVASCRYPPGILDRSPTEWTPDRPVGAGDRVISALFAHVDASANVDRRHLLLLVGDQIYVDATRGLFNPVMASDPFRESYNAFFHARFVQQALSRFERVEMMLDDHEIRDNWEPIKNESRKRIARDLRTATEDYRLFERFGLHAKLGARRYLDFPIVLPPAVFFIADTRTEREARTR